MGTSAITAQDAAQIILDAAAQGVYNPEALRGKLDLELGYSAQAAALKLKVANGAKQAGWKVGATSPQVRNAFGTPEAIYGYLLAGGHQASGCTVKAASLQNPMLEAELCFTLGAALRGPGVTPAQVLDAVAAVAPAFEIIEMRGDPAGDLGLFAAENVVHWGWITGTEVRPYPRTLELGGVQVTLTLNGEVAVQAYGRDVIDPQLETIAWLANRLAGHGLGLTEGQRIMSGSFGRPHPIKPGQAWEATFSGVGSVTCRFD